MAKQVVPQLLRQHLKILAENGDRIDGRAQWQGREVDIEVDCLYNADGSAKVVWGDTIVYVGVKFEVREPYSDRPTQGSLMCGAELRPVAHRKYEPGPPSPESIELGRVVDRGIRESGCIDMESLCIVPGESVWMVVIDIHVISDGGNIFDAAGLAAIAALRNATVPAQRFDVGEDYKLPVALTPIICTFTRVGGRYVYDANEEEELGGAERVSITLGDNGSMHSMQKGLKGAFTAAELSELLDASAIRCAELRDIIDSKVA